MALIKIRDMADIDVYAERVPYTKEREGGLILAIVDRSDGRKFCIAQLDEKQLDVLRKEVV